MDKLIIEFDTALRTLLASPVSTRPYPDDHLPEAELTDTERQHAAGLMRVNHCGEVCAQALYRGQAITARNDEVRDALAQAAHEEVEHLAWTERRLAALGSRKSLLNPLWYGGSLALGMLAGVAGDRWSLGFLAETERQVSRHLNGHLARLPAADVRSRAVVARMEADETAHAETAAQLGAAILPKPVPTLMQLASQAMTRLSYRL